MVKKRPMVGFLTQLLLIIRSWFARGCFARADLPTKSWSRIRARLDERRESGQGRSQSSGFVQEWRSKCSLMLSQGLLTVEKVT
jgi:hypothetical protein